MAKDDHIMTCHHHGVLMLIQPVVGMSVVQYLLIFLGPHIKYATAMAPVAGIVLLGRRYTFLAYSSSQLKEQSTWFVCTSDSRSVTPEGIRTWMGDFMATIKIPAKCAARMGQCFSSTVQTSTLSLGEHRLIPDVERNGFVFSDGVGQISEQLLREVVLEVPWARDGVEAISAIQVGACRRGYQEASWYSSMLAASAWHHCHACRLAIHRRSRTDDMMVTFQAAMCSEATEQQGMRCALLQLLWFSCGRTLCVLP
jgi:hypothetical protein